MRVTAILLPVPFCLIDMSAFRLALRTVPRTSLASPVARYQQQMLWSLSKKYSTPSGLSQEAIQTRVLDVLKGFEKVDPAKVASAPVCSRKRTHKVYSLL